MAKIGVAAAHLQISIFQCLNACADVIAGGELKPRRLLFLAAANVPKSGQP
jgi:hypothetical protein